MKILQLGDIKLRDKSRLLVRVGGHKATGLFGECDGVQLTIDQCITRSCTINFVDVVMSREEAINLASSLAASAIAIGLGVCKCELYPIEMQSDPFPGL